jgi:hypothetical protein
MLGLSAGDHSMQQFLLGSSPITYISSSVAIGLLACAHHVSTIDFRSNNDHESDGTVSVIFRHGLELLKVTPVVLDYAGNLYLCNGYSAVKRLMPTTNKIFHVSI